MARYTLTSYYTTIQQVTVKKGPHIKGYCNHPHLLPFPIDPGMQVVHRLRESKMYFHQATKDRRILLIPGIHYFDAQPLLLQASALQVHMRESPLVGPKGAGETVDDPSSEEEQATSK